MIVWDTRDEPVDGPLCTALRAQGLDVVLEPVVTRRVRDGVLDVVNSLGADDWLVLTSPFAIGAAACPAARIPRVAVVGEPSRRAAEMEGMRVALVSSGAGARSLFAELRDSAVKGRVCYLRSSLAPIPQSWPGAELSCPVLYETVAREFDRAVAGAVDALAVASPSAVQAVGPVDLPFASIGRTTSDAIRALGREPWIEAPSPSFESLAAAIAAHAGLPESRRNG